MVAVATKDLALPSLKFFALFVVFCSFYAFSFTSSFEDRRTNSTVSCVKHYLSDLQILKCLSSHILCTCSLGLAMNGE